MDPSDEETPDTPRPLIRAVAPTKPLPFSDEAERHVLSCALIDAQTLERCSEAGIGPSAFYLPANRSLYQVMSGLVGRGVPIGLDTVAQELMDRKLLDQVGGLPGLMELTSTVPTTAHLTHFIDRVRNDAGKRELIRNSEQLIEHARNGSDLTELVTEAKNWIGVIAQAAGTPKKSEVLKLLESRRVTSKAAPVEPTTRLFLAGKPICTPANITTLISKAKTGKTTTLGAVVAAIIAAHFDRSTMDTFGFTAPHTKEAVVVIDTEQSPYDAYTCHTRSMARAGQQDDVDWLCHYALVGYTVPQLKEALVASLEQAKKKHGGIFMLILDGIADFVSSVNDEAECNEMVAWIRSLSVSYDCPVICVIHSNEGVKTGDDGRGHLGKQLTRKAESNLLLKKTGEVTVVTSEKQRKAPITESDGIAFTWDDTVGRHVSCGKPENVKKTGRPEKYCFNDYHHIFQKVGKKGITHQAAYNYARSQNGVGETTFRNLISAGYNNGELERFYESGQTMYRLPNLPADI